MAQQPTRPARVRKDGTKIYVVTISVEEDLWAAMNEAIEIEDDDRWASGKGWRHRVTQAPFAYDALWEYLEIHHPAVLERHGLLKQRSR